jgi:hypothetical protein
LVGTYRSGFAVGFCYFNNIGLAPVGGGVWAQYNLRV